MKSKQLKDLQAWVSSLEREMLSGVQSTAPSTVSARSTPSHVRGCDIIRRAREREEELSTPFYPLTQRSATPRGGNVYERLYAAGQVSSRKKDDSRIASSQAAEALDKSYSYAPHINPSPSSSAMPASERLYYMRVHYDRHKEELREQRIQEELKEVRDPVLCRNSERIAAGLVAGMQPQPVEERLLEAGVRRDKVVQDQAVQIELEKKARASPRISPLAAQLHRSGDITERLQRFVTIYSEHKQALAAQIRPPEPPPRPRRRSSSPSRLFSPIKHIKELPREFSFTPEISTKSRAMADRLGSPESRLFQQPSVRVKPEFSEDQQPFQPLINSKSEELAMCRESPGRRWEVLFREREKLERKRVALCEETAMWDAERDECSFYPLVKVTRKSTEPLYERLTKQSQDKLRRLTELRRNELESEISRCSFSPEVHDYRGSPHVDVTEKRGVERHYERIAKAHEEKKEKTKASNRYNGESWTNTPTQPRSPRLGVYLRMSYPSFFPESNLFTDRSLSPIPAVLEIDLATDRDEAALFARYPTFPDPHCSSLLIPANVITASGTEVLNLPTERATAITLTPTISPRRVLENSQGDRGKSMAVTVRLQTELRQLRAQIRELEQSAGNNEVAKLLQKVHELDRENKALKEGIEACRGEKRSMEAQLETISADKEAATEALCRAESRSAQRQSQFSIEDLESLQSELANLRLANESLRLSESRLSDELMAAKEHIKHLEIELLETESTCVARNRLKEDSMRQSRELIAKTSLELSRAVGRLFDGDKAEADLRNLQKKKEAVRCT